MKKEKINYEQSWCDYFTDCPFEQKEDEGYIIKVGSWECCTCPYFDYDDNRKRILYCNYKIKNGIK